MYGEHDTRDGLDDDPLSSASLRYRVRAPVSADGPGPAGTRPFGLQHARTVSRGGSIEYVYCQDRQIAIDGDGLPLIEGKGKEWESKATSDGDEGSEESVWGWEEQ